jgi:hypothetical protein
LATAYPLPLYAAVAVRFRHHTNADFGPASVRQAENDSYCVHCGADMYRSYWTGECTVYVDSANPRQCFIRKAEDVEPINDGHQPAAPVGSDPAATPP